MVPYTAVAICWEVYLVWVFPGRERVYLVQWGVHGPGGCTWYGGTIGPGVLYVVWGLPGAGGCTWSQWGLTDHEGVYLVLGVVPHLGVYLVPWGCNRWLNRYRNKFNNIIPKLYKLNYTQGVYLGSCVSCVHVGVSGGGHCWVFANLFVCVSVPPFLN